MFKFNQNSLYHPLDQFEIYIISIEGLNEWSWMLLSFITNVTTVTNVTLIFFSTTWFIRQLLYNKKYSTNVSQNPVSFLVLAAYAVVINIIKSNLILKRSQYFQTLFFLFIFIIIGNLVGLIPYSFTITSSFLVAFYIALSHFIVINYETYYAKAYLFVYNKKKIIKRNLILTINQYFQHFQNMKFYLIERFLIGKPNDKFNRISIILYFFKSLPPEKNLTDWVSYTEVMQTIKYLNVYIQFFMIIILFSILWKITSHLHTNKVVKKSENGFLSNVSLVVSDPRLEYFRARMREIERRQEIREQQAQMIQSEQINERHERLSHYYRRGRPREAERDTGMNSDNIITQNEQEYIGLEPPVMNPGFIVREIELSSDFYNREQFEEIDTSRPQLNSIQRTTQVVESLPQVVESLPQVVESLSQVDPMTPTKQSFDATIVTEILQKNGADPFVQWVGHYLQTLPKVQPGPTVQIIQTYSEIYNNTSLPIVQVTPDQHIRNVVWPDWHLGTVQESINEKLVRQQRATEEILSNTTKRVKINENIEATNKVESNDNLLETNNQQLMEQGVQTLDNFFNWNFIYIGFIVFVLCIIFFIYRSSIVNTKNWLINILRKHKTIFFASIKKKKSTHILFATTHKDLIKVTDSIDISFTEATLKLVDFSGNGLLGLTYATLIVIVLALCWVTYRTYWFYLYNNEEKIEVYLKPIYIFILSIILIIVNLFFINPLVLMLIYKYTLSVFTLPLKAITSFILPYYLPLWYLVWSILNRIATNEGGILKTRLKTLDEALEKKDFDTIIQINHKIRLRLQYYFWFEFKAYDTWKIKNILKLSRVRQYKK